MYPGSECVLASSGKLNGLWGSLWTCVQEVSVFWLLWLIRLLKMCPGSECVLASSDKLDSWWLPFLKMCPVCESVLASSGEQDCWWGFFWKCVQRVSAFWLCLASWIADGAPPEHVSRKWVCFGLQNGWWGLFWKCVQEVSVFWLLLSSQMAHEAPSENVSSMWVCFGFFWQARWFMRLLLKMCPVCECALASSDKQDGW